MSESLAFTKGHGTENDFVLLLDEEGLIDLSPALVRALCDRRAGIGADGVVRAVRAGALPDGHGSSSDLWFMDYRNRDGSNAEMCGNGARVFAAFLERVAGEDAAAGLTIATRAGERVITARGSGRYAVGMGRWTIEGGGEADAQVTLKGLGNLPAVTVDVGNPHTVASVSNLATLAAIDLTSAPTVDPTPPEGTNVEIVVRGDVGSTGRGSLDMRVYERGVGETRSCGTGACAAVVAMRAWVGDGASTEWDVRVPGGNLSVEIVENELVLVGPAVLVAEGVVDVAALTRG